MDLNQSLTDRLRRMVDRIVGEVDPDQVVLFGSQARGDATETSDVDLLIVLNTPFRDRRERVDVMTRLWRTLSDIRGPKDLLLYSQEEVDQWKDTSNHVIARAFREGEVLYER